MAKLFSFRTSDSSKKITTYLLESSNHFCALDFGSNNIPLNKVRCLNYIFITHEHSDHFMGLYNFEYAKILLDNKCDIFASNVTKDLIIAIFENSLKVGMKEKEIKTIRELLKRIKGLYFFESYKIDGHLYFKLFPSGHTFGSSMVYLNVDGMKLLYTGDLDYSSDDADRQYQIDLTAEELPDYIIADGTYLDSESFKDDSLKRLKENILSRGYNEFLCKPEKMVFFSKKLMSSKYINEKYCVVFSPEYKWYLNILKKYDYDPFITDKIVLGTSIYLLPEGRIPLFLSSKPKQKQTNVTGLVGLHISFIDFAYFLKGFDLSVKVLIGHYNIDKKADIEAAFASSSITQDYNVKVLNEGELVL